MLNDVAFKNIIALTGCKQAINANAVREHLKGRAANKRIDLARELQNKRLLCLKADVASHSSRSFLGLNVQYIENGKIILRNLAMIELLQRHTAEYLKEQILFTLLRYRLDSSSIYSVTTDNGANMLKMSRLLSVPPSVPESSRNCQRPMSCVNRDFDDLNSFTVSSDSEDETVAPSTSKDPEYSDSDLDHEYDGDTEIDDSEGAGPHFTDIFSVLTDTFENQDRISVVRCAAHTLQLAIHDTYKNNQIKDVINSARNIDKILRTPNYINMLKLKNKKLPILDCPTRWNSTLDMIERLNLLRDICNSIPVLNLPTDVWLQLDEIQKSLMPAKKLTFLLQREELTIGDFYIGWINCKFELKRLNSPISLSLNNHMDTREIQLYESDAFLNAVFLDPRINSTLKDDQKNRAKNNLRSLATKLQLQKNKENYSNNTENSVPMRIPEKTNTVNEEVQDFLNSMYLENHENILTFIQKGTNNKLTILESQLDLFLEEPLMLSTANIIEYWEKNKYKFSHLYELALIVLAVPATQVSVERLFSSLKFVVTHLRYNLKSDLIEDILLLRSNSLFDKK